MKQRYHAIAILIAIIGLNIIHKVTLILYFKPNTSLSILKTCQILWLSNNYYLRFIMLMNYLIKPFMIYFLLIMFIKFLQIKYFKKK